MSAAIEQYLRCLEAHDWDGFAACLTDDVVRVGPFGDTYTPKETYVAFISALMPTLVDYELRVDRVIEAGDVVTVELTETMTWDGRRIETPEALVFDLAADGRIAHIGIYIRTLAEPPA
jgi:ketosteroid isomerase-like protein